MRKLPDYHIHTNATEDGTATIGEIAAAAALKNIPEILICDHYICGWDSYRVGLERLEQHFRDAESIHAKTGVKVLIGLEIDYFEERLEEIEKTIGSFDFDLIIGAAHFVEGLGVASESHTHKLFSLYDPAACYIKALETLEAAVRTGLFDVMAHLDIIRKFSIKKFGSVPFDEYREQAGRVARAMAETETGFEINCRGFDHEPEEQYPGRDFLLLLKEHGIETVTIGSDAHRVSLVGESLERGARSLRKAGFFHLSTFRKRKPEKILLEEFDLSDPE